MRGLPSPPTEHSGWAFDEKIWIFGGIGTSPSSFLHDSGSFVRNNRNKYCNNQLLCFDPITREWTNQTCNGNVPSPHSRHATAQTRRKLILFGGEDYYLNCLHDLYELDMDSLTSTNIQTGQIHPRARYDASLTALNEGGLLVLHGGLDTNLGVFSFQFNDTWVLDLETQSWRQYPQNNIHHSCHTGFTGIHDGIIIIGGRGPHAIHIRLQPKSLQQLAIQTVHKYKNEVPKNSIPKKLWALF